jgi:hypothetical protein
MNKAIEIELSTSKDRLYIFFGGIAAGIAMPPFEFYASARIMSDTKVFLRDFGQCWYQNGLEGITEDVYSTARHIEDIIRQVDCREVFFVGNSMGGFAAILFSTLIGIGETIAFAPQTFVSPELRTKHRDDRWAMQIAEMHEKCRHRRMELDLRPLLLGREEQRKISVFVSRDDKLDYLHALHIKDIPGVIFHEMGGGGHNVVKLLRAEGKLPAIMSGKYS